jgi:hypothetical protein
MVSNGAVKPALVAVKTVPAPAVKSATVTKA